MEIECIYFFFYLTHNVCFHHVLKPKPGPQQKMLSNQMYLLSWVVKLIYAHPVIISSWWRKLLQSSSRPHHFKYTRGCQNIFDIIALSWTACASYWCWKLFRQTFPNLTCHLKSTRHGRQACSLIMQRFQSRNPLSWLSWNSSTPIMESWS